NKLITTFVITILFFCTTIFVAPISNVQSFLCGSASGQSSFNGEARGQENNSKSVQEGNSKSAQTSNGEARGQESFSGATQSKALMTALPEDMYEFEVINNEATIKGILQNYIDGFLDQPKVIDIDIPATIGGYPVVKIGDSAFDLNTKSAVGMIYNGVSFTSLNLANAVNLKELGASAFSFCKDFTEAIIPNGVTKIGNSAFFECSGLTGFLTIPDSVKNIGMESFVGCIGLTEIYLPENAVYDKNIFANTTAQLISPNLDKRDKYRADKTLNLVEFSANLNDYLIDITFDNNDGVTSVVEKKVAGRPFSICKNSNGVWSTGALPLPTMEGCSFNGWATTKDGATLIAITDNAPLTNATYYANWNLSQEEKLKREIETYINNITKNLEGVKKIDIREIFNIEKKKIKETPQGLYYNGVSYNGYKEILQAVAVIVKSNAVEQIKAQVKALIVTDNERACSGEALKQKLDLVSKNLDDISVENFGDLTNLYNTAFNEIAFMKMLQGEIEKMTQEYNKMYCDTTYTQGSINTLYANFCENLELLKKASEQKDVEAIKATWQEQLTHLELKTEAVPIVVKPKVNIIYMLIPISILVALIFAYFMVGKLGRNENMK
ncbi:MAG: leucine-rich repeat domain-containing protein, partial [Clostridia bacterium]